MITRNLVVEKTVPLKNGINLDTLPEIVKRNTYYKHKDINDLAIHGNEGSTVNVPSERAMNILQTWGIDSNISGIFVLTNSSSSGYGYGYKHNVDIVKQQFTTTYECNSRDILREVNELERIIVAGRKLADISTRDGAYFVPTQLLITASMCNDADKTVSLLRKYQTSSITRTIKSPFFRHIYKLVHPKTTFIRTPIPTELTTK